MRKRLKYLLPVLLFAAVGGYFVFASQAATRFDRVSHGFNEYWNYGDFRDSNYIPQPGDTLKGTIEIDINVSPENTYKTAYQAIYVISYDTKFYEFTGGNCSWKYGCTISSVNTGAIDAYAKVDNAGYGMHKARVAICFNIPPNTRVNRTIAFTHTLKRTSYKTANDATNHGTWTTTAGGHADGSCASNPSGSGFLLDYINDYCGISYACDNGTGPGIGCAQLSGMSNCTGPGPGTGNGSGGTGTGTNGQGSGVGPGAGSGGGGSSATRQGDQPNTTPTTSNQGDSKEEPKLEPSPFFDGKEYAPGSDPIDKALGNISVGGKRIIHGWLYISGLFFILANLFAAYFLWWRRMSPAEQLDWKRRLHLRT